MDDLKCKKRKVDRKKNDLLIKLRKKINKKRKSQGGEDLKPLKGAPKNLEIGTRRSRPGKPVGKANVQGGIEGMFFKGLRSEYITREPLNEANEARKKEDLNRIIDIGRDFHERGGRRGRSKKWETVGNPQHEKWARWFGDDGSDCADDLERCSLSPISVTPTCEEYDRMGGDLETRTMKTSQFDLEKEFEKFSLKYEQAVESQVLLRLPEHGVLEDAVTALRKKRTFGKVAPGERGRGSSASKYSSVDAFGGVSFVEEFMEEGFKFRTQDSPSGLPQTEDFISPEKIFNFSEGHNRDRFAGKSCDYLLNVADVEVENYYRPSFTPLFSKDDDIESLNVFHFDEKDFEKPNKDLSITTPTIQFYRRNMF